LGWHNRCQDPYAAAAASESGDVMVAARAATQRLVRQVGSNEMTELVKSLERAGSFGFFAGVPSETTRRRDRYMFPLNTDYDLFSLGADRQTAVSLGHALGQDDIIRANNGSFFGLASEY
jgi:hypothetical protein